MYNASSSPPGELLIPKILHQIWLGDQDQRPTQWLDTWKSTHPDWDYRLWTEENLPELECWDQIDAMPHFAGKADILRYELLFKYGGIYLDADSKCIRPLPAEMLLNYGFAAWENEYVRPGLIANGVIGTRPGCKLMQSLMTAVQRIPPASLRTIPLHDVWKATGPALLTAGIQGRLGCGAATHFRIYTSSHFYPTHYTGIQYTGTPVDVYAEQFWSSTAKLQSK